MKKTITNKVVTNKVVTFNISHSYSVCQDIGSTPLGGELVESLLLGALQTFALEGNATADEALAAVARADDGLSQLAVMPVDIDLEAATGHESLDGAVAPY